MSKYYQILSLMKRKTELIVAIGFATIITCYIYNKFVKRRKTNFDLLKKEGDEYFVQNDYNSAIISYTKCLYFKHDREISNRLGICYYKLKQYKEALEYIKEKTTNLEILKIRIECYKSLEMKVDFLKDFALYEAFMKNDKMQEKIMQVLKEICENEALSFIKKEGVNIKKQEILKGLTSIKNVEVYYDDIINKTIDVNNSLEDASDKSKHKHNVYNLIGAIIKYCTGQKEEALDLLKDSSYKYSILIKAYFFTLLDKPIDFEVPLDDKITSLYFHSKIYKDKAEEYLKKALEKAGSLDMNTKDFLYVDLLLYYILKKDTVKIEETVSEISDSITPSLLDLIGEYYLKNGNFTKLLNLLSVQDDSPSKLLLMGLYYLSMDKKQDAIHILYRCINDYPDYFKAYLYLGNILINDNLEESKRLFYESLKLSSNYDEVYIIKQSLLLIEVHEYIKENKE